MAKVEKRTVNEWAAILGIEIQSDWRWRYSPERTPVSRQSFDTQLKKNKLIDFVIEKALPIPRWRLVKFSLDGLARIESNVSEMTEELAGVDRYAKNELFHKRKMRTLKEAQTKIAEWTAEGFMDWKINMGAGFTTKWPA